MSYQETKSLTNIISTILITGIYALVVYQRYLNGIGDTSDVLRFWSITILIFIPISIVARIIILIIFSIIATIVQTAKGEEVDELDLTDERDKLIELKATKISMMIFALGFVLALVTQAVNMSEHMFFITMMVSGVFTEVVSDLATIVYYRKGL
ncbi:MAG: hypothetical protein KJ847_00675 [Firmicutes bacterium]|nr:hypothetical protein [Bacillota bacterium]